MMLSRSFSKVKSDVLCGHGDGGGHGNCKEDRRVKGLRVRMSRRGGQVRAFQKML